MTIATLKSQNLKRICSFDQYLITLDEDGVFDLYVKDVLGDTVFDRVNYSFVESVMPSKLFQILNRNAKREVAV